MNLRTSPVIRQFLWRAGRRLYTYARGEGANDPRRNGEYWLLRHALQSSSGAQVLLDIGANQGDWSAEALLAADAAGQVRVHAFEPASGTRAMLAARFSGNSAVDIQPFALSDAPGDAIFYSLGAGAGTSSLSSSPGAYPESARVTTIDAFLEQAAIRSVLMAKIDTEGFDLLVMKGAQKALREGRIGIVQFEYNSRWLPNHSSLHDVFELIADKPYRLGKLVGEHLEVYERWHPELDRFFETNYVLVRLDSALLSLGRAVQFNQSNVAISGITPGKPLVPAP
jgi:FkbM family methyltransferase